MPNSRVGHEGEVKKRQRNSLAVIHPIDQDLGCVDSYRISSADDAESERLSAKTMMGRAARHVGMRTELRSATICGYVSPSLT